MDTKYSVLSINTRGIRINDRCDLILNFCEQLDADSSVFQETHANISSLEISTNPDIKYDSFGKERCPPGLTKKWRVENVY